MLTFTNNSLKQLQDLVDEYFSLKDGKYTDASHKFSKVKAAEIKTRAIAAIRRISGNNSVYYEQCQREISKVDNVFVQLYGLIGILQSLIADINNGYIEHITELIHSEIFGDYLEMASYLCNSNYKDAAAVIAGSTLESHLKQLCIKSKIDIEIKDKSGDTKPKKADVMNSELAKNSIYSKIDQKNVTAWLGLRNDAAHGNYGAYSKNQVTLMIDSIRDFITRNPA